VFIYTDQWAKYAYGPHHPLKPIRLHLTYDLMQTYGLLDGPAQTILAVEASTDTLLRFHAPEYLQLSDGVGEGVTVPTMNRYGLGPGDNPVFPGLLRFSALVVGASLQAAGTLSAEDWWPVQVHPAAAILEAVTSSQ
jgi:acetoin utilization protein AcuC